MKLKPYRILIYLFMISFLSLSGPVEAQQEIQEKIKQPISSVAKTIQLSAPDLERGKLLMQALKERKSTRSFSPKKLPLDVLSNLLWAASGVNRPETGLLTAPTASNRQEIDVYVALEEGLYLYNPVPHTLSLVLEKDIRKSTGRQPFTQKAPVNLIFVADYSKMGGSQESRDFYSATDTGYISQNVYLFCASEGLVTVVLGWVDRPSLKKIMNLNDDQVIILTQPVGYPK